MLGQATSFVAVYVYSSTIIGSEGNSSAKSSYDFWALLGAVETGFVIFFAIFVSAMAAKYRVTFFSTMTAKKFAVHRFYRSRGEFGKVDVAFLEHPSYTESIREEVKQWVNERYSTWVEEEPEWFTERVRKSIPIDMIPEEEGGEWKGRTSER